MPPEWFDTTSAPPAFGIDSSPRTSARKYRLMTGPTQFARLFSEVAPAAVIHLAAIIPPLIYRKPKLARRVNVEATATVVRTAEAQPTPPRFVQASSNAVFGPRNPHRNNEILRAADPM